MPDELALLGKVTAIAAAGGIAGTLLLWAAQPDRLVSPTMLLVGVVLTLTVGVAALVAPWRRMSRRWVMVPVLSGAALTALACWNTGGAGSPFMLFYLYVASMAAYFASRAETMLASATVAVGAALPLLYDHDAPLADRLFEWVLISSLAGALALVLQHQRVSVREAAAHAHALALQDPLTGVANRRGFAQRAASELARSRRRGLQFTVLYLDLDGFKRVNDEAGHAAGDELLRRVALAISVAVRGEDFVARHGGDEFAVLLPATDEREARRVAARIRAAVERTAADDDGLPSLSASVGGASYPADGDTLADLMQRADGELMRVKAERSFDRERVSRDFAIPDAAVMPEDDVFAGLGSHAEPGEAVEEPAGWRMAPVLALTAALGALVVAAWALAGALGDASQVQQAIAVAAALAVVPPALGAARRAVGRERAGWAVVAGAALLSWLSLFSLPSGLGFGLAILLLGAAPRKREWRALLGMLDIFTLLSAFALVFLMPPLLAHAGEYGLGPGQSLAAALVPTAASTCALLVLTTVSVRVRPDMWMVAVGFGLAAVAAVPLTLEAHGPASMPVAWWHVVFPLAAVLVFGGALARALGPRGVLTSGRGDRAAPGTVVGNLLLGALLVAVVVTRGAIPAELIPLVLVSLALRHLRARIIEGDNTRLEELARRGERDVAAQYRASLVALGTALEARDGYTGSHGEETVTLVRRVAEKLGMAGHATAEAEAVALLHDVGKIGMPDEILRKPGRLAPDEMAIMREHPMIGERILRQVPGLARVARAVRHEHERWDGRGYPDGLAGEAIPLASRITLVCDAYHAMTSDRPYRRAMSHDDAAAELRRCAGTQFDPAVVRALLEALEELDASDAARPAEPVAAGAPHQAAS